MREIATPQTQLKRDPSKPFEYLIVTTRPEHDLAEVRRQLAEYAEYGKWDLHRTRLYMGGARRYWMRRRILRVERTLPPIQ
jgi:hypothetical protein